MLQQSSPSSSHAGIKHTAVSPAFWYSFRHELFNYDADLLFFPQRRFDFPISHVSILVNQTFANVGTTVWDAELLMSHFIDSHDILVQGTVVLELGAGTAIAGILCAHMKNLELTVVVQELEEVIPHTVECFQMNGIDSYGVVPGRWGADLVSRVLSLSHTRKVNCILLADGLYHTEDFTSLIETISGCLEIDTGQLLLVYEQRRKDLTKVVNEFARLFRECECYKYTIVAEVGARSADIYVYHMTQFIGSLHDADDTCDACTVDSCQ